MREKRLYALPVIGTDEQFLGEIRLKDVLRLRKEGVKSLKNGGKLQLDEHIPYTAQMIATLTRHQLSLIHI